MPTSTTKHKTSSLILKFSSVAKNMLYYILIFIVWMKQNFNFNFKGGTTEQWALITNKFIGKKKRVADIV